MSKKINLLENARVLSSSLSGKVYDPKFGRGIQIGIELGSEQEKALTKKLKEKKAQLEEKIESALGVTPNIDIKYLRKEALSLKGDDKKYKVLEFNYKLFSEGFAKKQIGDLIEVYKENGNIERVEKLEEYLALSKDEFPGLKALNDEVKYLTDNKMFSKIDSLVENCLSYSDVYVVDGEKQKINVFDMTDGERKTTFTKKDGTEIDVYACVGDKVNIKFEIIAQESKKEKNKYAIKFKLLEIEIMEKRISPSSGYSKSTIINLDDMDDLDFNSLTEESTEVKKEVKQEVKNVKKSTVKKKEQVEEIITLEDLDDEEWTEGEE